MLFKDFSAVLLLDTAKLVFCRLIGGTSKERMERSLVLCKIGAPSCSLLFTFMMFARITLQSLIRFYKSQHFWFSPS